MTHSSPGGGSDLFLRDLAKHLGPIMGVHFVVENITGGSGAKAMAYVAQAKPDGSVFYATTPTYIQTSLLSKPEFGYTALEPVAIVFQDPEVIFTRADAPWKSLSELLDYARRNPGKSRWGAANPASLERIALERLAQKAGVKAPIVPHEGGGDMMINVLNGTLDIGVGEVQELQGQLQAGKVRLLATLSERRLALLARRADRQGTGRGSRRAQVPRPGGPKGIPPEVTQALEAGLAKALEDPAYKASYTKNDLLPAFMGRAGGDGVHEGVRRRADAVAAAARRRQMSASHRRRRTGALPRRRRARRIRRLSVRSIADSPRACSTTRSARAACPSRWAGRWPRSG